MRHDNTPFDADSLRWVQRGFELAVGACAPCLADLLETVGLLGFKKSVPLRTLFLLYLSAQGSIQFSTYRSRIEMGATRRRCV